jgi:hypothetical protein
MNGFSLMFVLLGLLFSMATPRAQAEVLFSEIHYHPVEHPEFDESGYPLLDLSEDVHEFVEIHNPGPDQVALGGYRITGAIRFTFPAGAIIEPGGYSVVAKHPDRLKALDVYDLNFEVVFGPYEGQLSNQSDVLRLRDADNQLLDWVRYSDAFPWAILADGFGANDRFTGLNLPIHQYLGCSLERVSFDHDTTDPANWVASPLDGHPSPGRPNSVQRAVPKPVVIGFHIAQASNGSPVLSADSVIQIDAEFSSDTELSQVGIEYFVWDLNSTDPQPLWQLMERTSGSLDSVRYSTQLQGFKDRNVVRYRFVANRGDGVERVSPRQDDPFEWHGFFITPPRPTDLPYYDLFIRTQSRNQLASNIGHQPRRVINPDPPGYPRESWNATEPAIFVCDNSVYDVYIRHRGSRWNRQASRNAYKVHFPRYARFKEQSAILLTDKGDDTVAGHALFRAAGIPTSRTQTVRMHLNDEAVRTRLEMEVQDGRMLQQFRSEQVQRYPDREIPPVGLIYKSRGLDHNEGPYGRGDGSRLPNRSIWSPLNRYTWTYNLKNQDWIGHTPFIEMLEGMWNARNFKDSGLGDVEIQQLRDYFETHWNVDLMLNYITLINWMSPWDDLFHNYYVWRDGDGKWCLVPWDFDGLFGEANTSIFAGEMGDRSNNFRGHNYFKDSFIKAFREELKARFFLLNNTLLAPDNIQETTDRNIARNFANRRRTPVNTQSGFGSVFHRPERPVPAEPMDQQAVTPPIALRLEPYQHSQNPAPVHLRTTWVLWEEGQSAASPLARSSQSTNLVSWMVPSELLGLGKRYFWQATFEDELGHPSPASLPMSFTVGHDPEIDSGVVINEFLAVNSQSVPHYDAFPDWIELYNSGSVSVNVGGWFLSDDLLRPDRFMFPPNTWIAPHGHLIVWCTEPMDPEALYADFALNRDGELVALFRPTEDGHELVDWIVFGFQLEDHSLGRVPDGIGDWQLTEPTPGLVNVAHPVEASFNVRINEWMATPLSGEDWIELYNPNAHPVDLGNHFLTDRLIQPDRSQLPPFSFVPAQGYHVLVADGNPERGASHLDFSLSAVGEEIGLFDPEGNTIDSLAFGPQSSGVSQGRFPDGADEIIFFPETPSPGEPNFLPGTGPEPGYLQIDVSHDAEFRGLILRFFAQANQRFVLQYRDRLMQGEWVDGPELGPSDEAGWLEWEEAIPSAENGGARYYRFRRATD